VAWTNRSPLAGRNRPGRCVRRSGKQRAFTKISRAVVVAGLRARVQDPNRIDQGTSSLCGPSALVRTIALTDPLAYVTFIISLFETGRGEIGDLKVAAGDDLLNYDPGLQVPAVDWIPTASIRDSENWFFDYQAAENQFAGITLPSHMEEWFKKIGFREVINDTNLVLRKNENNLRRASDLYEKDYWVCLFIHPNMLAAETMRNTSTTAAHWVVLTSAVKFSGTNVSFTVYSWAEGQKPVPEKNGPLSVSDLLKNYYGFVATRR
jgi:hypothetical protein